MDLDLRRVFPLDFYLPLQAAGAGGVPRLQKTGRGGPAGRVLSGRRPFGVDFGIAANAAERPVDGQQGGVAAPTHMEGHVWGEKKKKC